MKKIGTLCMSLGALSLLCFSGAAFSMKEELKKEPSGGLKKSPSFEENVFNKMREQKQKFAKRVEETCGTPIYSPNSPSSPRNNDNEVIQDLKKEN